VKRPSVCRVASFGRSCGGFAAERRACGREISTAAGTRQWPALSSECGQCHVDGGRRMLNTADVVDWSLLAL